MRRLLLAYLLVLAGCAGSLPVATDGPAGSPAGDVAHTVTVTRVVDGDTLEITYPNGTADTVRLLGVDTPEVHAENTPGEFEGVPETDAGRACLRRWGERASAHAKSRLVGETVGLTFDASEGPRGRYGRLLAYVRVGGEPFNYGLVADGYARVYDSRFERSDRFYVAESTAREQGKGLWECATASPPPGSATGTDSRSGGVAVRVHADAAGDDRENLTDEYVTLVNRGDAALNLAGWTVRDAAGATYTFGDRHLSPGAAITLHTGSGEDTGRHVYWGRASPVWNNDGDTVTVRDAGGTVVVERSY